MDMQIIDINRLNATVEEGSNRKAYVNSERGRQELQIEISEPYLSEILEVWGDESTNVDEQQKELTEEEKLLLELIPSQEEILNAELEIKILTILQEVII